MAKHGIRKYDDVYLWKLGRAEVAKLVMYSIILFPDGVETVGCAILVNYMFISYLLFKILFWFFFPCD